MLQSRRPRRFGTVAALLGLIFASTVASVSHSLAMPMMAGPAPQSAVQASPVSHQGHDQAAKHDTAPTGHHMARASHDCEADVTDNTPRQQSQGPCDNGCQQCKDCTMTVFVLMSPIGIDAAERYGRYAPATAQALVSIAPISANEPPRL